MVKKLLKIVGNGSFENIPWPEDSINVETGDYITNIDKAKKYARVDTKTDFEKGLQKL